MPFLCTWLKIHGVEQSFSVTRTTRNHTRDVHKAQNTIGLTIYPFWFEWPTELSNKGIEHLCSQGICLKECIRWDLKLHPEQTFMNMLQTVMAVICVHTCICNTEKPSPSEQPTRSQSDNFNIMCGIRRMKMEHNSFVGWTLKLVICYEIEYIVQN